MAVALLLVFGLTACDVLAPGNESRVGVVFKIPLQGSAAISDATASVESSLEVNRVLRISGSNGSLDLHAVHFIVDDLTLKEAGADCDSAEDEDSCEDDGEGPTIAELLVNDDEDQVDVTALVEGLEAGEITLEVEDADGNTDEAADDDDEWQQFLEDLLSRFGNWPKNGSLRVSGTFTPADTSDSPRDFTVYFGTETRIEKELPRPLVIDDGTENQTVTVFVDPAIWFTRPDGSVMDLSQHDYATTGSVADLEIPLRNGFTEIELGS